MSTALSSNKQLGLHILQPTQQAFGLLNRLKLEWDYFMVHDRAGSFTGSIGYVLADPAIRNAHGLNRFKLLPSGVSVAIAGMFTKGFPLDTAIYAHNQDYIVETKLSIGDREIALLYKNSWYTRIYVIFVLFPFCKGSIYRVADGVRVLEFSGQGGGEYSTLRFPKT